MVFCLGILGKRWLEKIKFYVCEYFVFCVNLILNVRNKIFKRYGIRMNLRDMN